MTVPRSGTLTIAEAKVYVVADPYEAELVARWLLDDGFTDVRRGDGGDDTLADLQQDPAHLMVLAATLTVGDSLSFASAVRESAEPPMLVLIGDEKGPVRTALDAMDFGADRFLRRPLVRGALLWAVKSALQLHQVPANVLARVAVVPAVPVVTVVPTPPEPEPAASAPSPGASAVAAVSPTASAVTSNTEVMSVPPVPPSARNGLTNDDWPPVPAIVPMAPPRIRTDPAVSGAAIKLSEVMEHAIDAYLQDAMEDVLAGASMEDLGDAADTADDREATGDGAGDDTGDAVDADAIGAVVDEDTTAAVDEFADDITGIAEGAALLPEPQAPAPTRPPVAPEAEDSFAGMAEESVEPRDPLEAGEHGGNGEHAESGESGESGEDQEAVVEVVYASASLVDEQVAALIDDIPDGDAAAPSSTFDHHPGGMMDGEPGGADVLIDASTIGARDDEGDVADYASSSDADQPEAIPSWREPTIDPAPSPPWREPTHIISGAAAMGGGAPPAPAVAAAYLDAGESYNPSTANDDALVDALSPPPVAPEEARTGTFVSELKRTMSAIEQRLFGEDGANGASAGYEEAAPDIDLDAIAVGSTIPGVTFDARARATMALEDETRGFEEVEPGERRTTSPRVIATQGVKGDLRDDDVASLVARLHREGFSGRVTFRRGEAQKTVFFESGRLVFATSNLPHDRMGDLLYREGKITREQHARSREIVAETGRRMGEILVEMGFLKRRELLPAVRRHVEDIVYSLFGWDSGSFTILAGEGAQDEKIRLATHPAALVLEGIRRKIGLDRLRERLGPPTAVVAPLKRDDIAGVLAEADLSAEERQAADLFDGRRTIAEVATTARLDELTVYQLAHGLVALGHARVVESTRGETDSGRAPSGSLAGAADIAIDRERVLAKHAHVLEADYFAVLGVRRDATTFEIRRAYESARRDYAPDTFPAEVQREHGAELREILGVLDEAFRVLRDDRVRAQYLQNLRE